MNETFFALTPERVLESVEQAGLAPSGHCLQLNSLENRVYDLRLEDGAHVVAKFYRPGRWSAEQIQEEHDFLFELAEQDIPVIAPLRFSDGGSLKEIGGIFCAVWPRRGGRPADEPNDEDMLALGRITARLHNVGAARPARHRLQLNASAYVRAPLAFLESQGFPPPYLRERYQDAALTIADLYDRLSADVPILRIHGDLHSGNLLRSDSGWLFLDFDDFVSGPAAQDVWMLQPGHDAYALRKRALFLEGYRQFRAFEDHWLKLIEPLRAMRFIHYAAWITRRREDPAFVSAFPEFGTDDYWEGQCADLEQQYNVVVGEDPELATEPDNAEPELTNKDFFWDWEDKPRE